MSEVNKEYDDVNDILYQVSENSFSSPTEARNEILNILNENGYTVDKDEKIYNDDELNSREEMEIVVPIEENENYSLYFSFFEDDDGYKIMAEVADQEDLDSILKTAFMSLDENTGPIEDYDSYNGYDGDFEE